MLAALPPRAAVRLAVHVAQHHLRNRHPRDDARQLARLAELELSAIDEPGPLALAVDPARRWSRADVRRTLQVADAVLAPRNAPREAKAVALASMPRKGLRALVRGWLEQRCNVRTP